MLRQPTSFQHDFDWQDGYLPEVRRILLINALFLFNVGVATFQQDVKQATDMVMSVTGQKAVAVRLRRAAYPYRDLTLRAERSSGATTELDKIKQGYGDCYLYGWTHDLSISEWMLIDLHQLRTSGLLDAPRFLISNLDRRTRFIAISYATLREYGCVLNARVML